MTKPKLQTAEFSIDTSAGEVAYLSRGDDGATMVRLTLTESKVRELVGPLPWLDKPDGPGWWWRLRDGVTSPTLVCSKSRVGVDYFNEIGSDFTWTCFGDFQWQRILDARLPGE